MREARFSVNFAVSIMWQTKSGLVRRITGRCVDLSPDGIGVEATDRLDKDVMVLVTSHEFGRMGMANVRYCQRYAMKCVIGMRFGAPFGLGDPARKKILERVIASTPPDAATRKALDAVVI